MIYETMHLKNLKYEVILKYRNVQGNKITQSLLCNAYTFKSTNYTCSIYSMQYIHRSSVNKFIIVYLSVVTLNPKNLKP